MHKPFIKLTQNKSEFYINVNHIITMETTKKGTVITTGPLSQYTVKESIEEIDTAISNLDL